MAQIAQPMCPHQAQGYVMVDGRGRTLAALTADGLFPSLKFYDESGRVTARFGLRPDGPSLRIIDAEGKTHEFLVTKGGVRLATE